MVICRYPSMRIAYLLMYEFIPWNSTRLRLGFDWISMDDGWQRCNCSVRQDHGRACKRAMAGVLSSKVHQTCYWYVDLVLLNPFDHFCLQHVFWVKVCAAFTRKIAWRETPCFATCAADWVQDLDPSLPKCDGNLCFGGHCSWHDNQGQPMVRKDRFPDMCLCSIFASSFYTFDDCHLYPLNSTRSSCISLPFRTTMMFVKAWVQTNHLQKVVNCPNVSVWLILDQLRKKLVDYGHSRQLKVGTYLNTCICSLLTVWFYDDMVGTYDF